MKSVSTVIYWLWLKHPVWTRQYILIYKYTEDQIQLWNRHVYPNKWETVPFSLEIYLNL